MIEEKNTNLENDNQTVSEPVFDYNKEYTYADYVKFEIEEMVELIRGKVFRMSTAPRSVHQVITGNVYGTFWSFLKGKRCRTYVAPFDVILPIKNKKRDKATTVVQPDVCVICNPEIVEDAGCFGVPDLIVEVVASKRLKKDVQDKFSVYEEAGVSEYWIVFADQRCVEVFVLENGAYKRINTFAESDVIPVHTIPDLIITVDDIFQDT